MSKNEIKKICAELSQKVYQDGDWLLKPTGESPQKFPGLLFIVNEGKSPETVRESARTLDQLNKLDEIDSTTLSQEWKIALGLPEEPSKCSEPPILVASKPSQLGLVAVLFFLGMSILMYEIMREVKLSFIILCIIGGTWALLYECFKSIRIET